MSGFLVQVILPVYDNDGVPISREQFARVRRELASQFGGVTAYTRAPAEGLWESPEGDLHRDDVVVVETMTEQVDRRWWADYSQELAARFRQQAVIVRALAFESLS
ncbi:MAG TPA: hypothetical protein VN654_08825 [Vicinamibacterales bacterium]|jgi:hypothetical protein|nr:hypothetical protein [Vicinamibacterales bacterium]